MQCVRRIYSPDFDTRGQKCVCFSYPRWYATSQPPEQLRHSLERLRQAAEQAGRPVDELALSLRLPLRAEAVQGSKQAIIDQYGAYKTLGLTTWWWTFGGTISPRC